MSNGLGEDDPAGQRDHHHDLTLVQATGDVVPERNGQGLDYGPNATKKSGLGGVHAELLEVDAHQGEQGAEGSIEEKVKQLGHDETSLSWVGEAAGEKGGGAFGHTCLGLRVLVWVYPVVLVIARLFPPRQTFGCHVFIAQGLRALGRGFCRDSPMGSPENGCACTPGVVVFVGDGHVFLLLRRSPSRDDVPEFCGVLPDRLAHCTAYWQGEILAVLSAVASASSLDFTISTD